MTGNGSPPPPPDAELTLRVFPQDDALVWEVTNAGTENVRLWEQSNSWGWPMPRLHVSPADGSEQHRLDPAPRLWTRNFPSSMELAPQESARYELRAGDFDPDTVAPVRQLAGAPLRVRGELQCEPSAEAVEHGVWIGTLRGQEQELSPPHEWLQPES